MSDDLIIKMADIRRAKMCSRGTRQFFIDHDLDWNKFLTDGIPAQELENTGHAMALEVVEVARGRG